MILREMLIDDLEQVMEIERELFHVPWTREGFFTFLTREDAMFLVVEEKGQILGYCGLLMVLDEGDITNVAVRPDHRKKGIADAILTDVLSESQKRGARTIYLEVRESNLPAQKLYEKHGFVSCGIRKNFYRKPTEHAIVMSCDLTRRISE